MARLERTLLKVPSGYRAPEVASIAAQLDDQTKLLLLDLRGARPAELAWQPAPAMNTIGMLLAHLAIVEVFWTQIGVLRQASDIETVLGIDEFGDGIPFPRDGRPPAGLKGRGLPYFARLLARARAYAKRHARAVTTAALARPITRRRQDGTAHTYNLRWLYYHLLEHFSGHYGQILLLRHQYRDRRALAAPRRRPAPRRRSR